MRESLTFSIEDIFPMRKPKVPAALAQARAWAKTTTGSAPALPSTMTEIEFADHRKFRLGDRIVFYVPGSLKHRGTIIEITVDGMVKVDPGSEDCSDMAVPYERRDGWLRCRDFGITGGLIIGMAGRK